MKLNAIQQAMLEGKHGKSCKRAIELLIQMGEASNAEELIPVTFVHLLPPDIMFFPYGRTGRWAKDMTYELLEDVTAFRVPVTLDPQFCNLYVAETLQFSTEEIEEIRDTQLNAMKRYEALGGTPNYSALAFYHRPGKLGDHASIADSTPIIYYNTIYGTRTERDDGIKALAAAITGFVPNSGVHLTENRYAEVIVRIDDDLDISKFEDADWDLFALAVAKLTREKRPAIVGMPKLDMTDMKHFLAVLAVMAGIPLVHIVGVTPEAPTLEAATQGHTPEAEFIISKNEIEAAKKVANTTIDTKINYVMMGCPHLTMKEIKIVADEMRGKKVSEGVRLVAVTTKELYEQAEDMGYVSDIVNAGGQVTYQMCIAFAGTQVRNAAVLTNSAKAGFWYSGFGAKEKQRTVRLASTRICAKSAIAGKVVE